MIVLTEILKIGYIGWYELVFIGPMIDWYKLPGKVTSTRLYKLLEFSEKFRGFSLKKS